MCLFYSLYFYKKKLITAYIYLNLKKKKKKYFYTLFLFGFKEMMLFSSRSLTLNSYINCDG